MNDACEYGDGIFGWFDRNKRDLIISLFIWLSFGAFIAGFKFGVNTTKKYIPDLIKYERLQERKKAIRMTVDQVNALYKNRGSYERLRFRASEWGASLEM